MAARITTPRELEMAEDIYLNGFADEVIGSVDEIGHVYTAQLATGPWVMVVTDSQGFKHGLIGSYHDIVMVEFSRVELAYEAFWEANPDDV